MTEFQKWLNMVGTCKKNRWFILSDFMQFLFMRCEEQNNEQGTGNEWIKILQ